MSTKIIDWLDKPRRMTIDLQSEMMLEKMLGKGLQQASTEMIGPTLLVTVLYCGLARHDSGLSFREARELAQNALNSKRISGLDFQNQMMEMLVGSASFSGFRNEDEDGEPVPLLESSTND